MAFITPALLTECLGFEPQWDHIPNPSHYLSLDYYDWLQKMNSDMDWIKKVLLAIVAP